MGFLKLNNIQTKVILTFIVLMIVLLSIFNVYNYFSNKSEETEKLQRLSQFTVERLSKNFIVPLWNMEMEELNSIIRFEMGERQISALIVTDAAGKTVVGGAQRNENWGIVETKSLEQSGSLSVKKEIKKDDEVLGQVSIYFTDQFLNQRLTRDFLKFTATFSILAILLAVSLAIVINRIVVKPVNQVVELTARLKDGDLSARLEAGNDQIGAMINAINGFTEDLQKAIQQINQSMKAVAAGNLTQVISIELKGDLNDLKSSINESIVMLGKTISEVVDASSKVKNGAGEISTSANTLANGTSQQAAAIEQMTSSINEFSSQTKTNNDNASQAQQLSNQTHEIVNRGNRQMESMLKSINEINDTSAKVSKVIKVIDEIAFQTNLLALNAAVEAARAGKYGKGFAVVAEEVRSLASRSAEAVKSTTELIEASLSEVEKGVSNADQTATVLNEIAESINKTNDLVGEISSASKEQATGIDEINRGLSQINEIVQQNSAISEETASSSEDLSGQANQMESLMSKFQLNTHTSYALNTEPEPTYKPDFAEPKIPRVKSHVLDYQPEAQPKESGSKQRKEIILDDDDFGKY